METIKAVLQCGSCKHHRSGRNCDAFPDEHRKSGMIPLPIFNDKFDHRKPYPGDHGIRWEPVNPDQPHPFDVDDRYAKYR